MRRPDVALPGPEPSLALSMSPLFDFLTEFKYIWKKVVSLYSEYESSLKGLKLTELEVASGLNYRHFRTVAVLDNASTSSRGRKVSGELPADVLFPERVGEAGGQAEMRD